MYLGLRSNNVEPISIVLLGAGLLTGGAMGWLLANQKLGREIIRSEERLRAQADSESKLKAEIESLAMDIGRKNSDDFLKLATERLGNVQTSAEKDIEARTKAVEELITPIRKQLQDLEKATTEMERNREGAYQGLKRTVEGLHKETVGLRDTNVQLSTALRGSIKARGKWGQMALKNIAESAGMIEHCDFDVEDTLVAGRGGLRVDMVARIPGGGKIPVDAKVPLASYWDALESEDFDLRARLMEEHARAVKKHIDDLSNRNYSDLVEGADFTVMFIPAEPILSAAFEINPSLQEYAFNNHILIATPVTLIALLRTVGIYWQQQSSVDNSREILENAKEFYDRAAKFGGDLMRVGNGLTTALNAYNEAVGSYGNVIPSGRRLEGLRVADGSARKLPEIRGIEKSVRNDIKKR